MVKTVAFDLDDTLCTRKQQEGGPEKYKTCKPIPKMINIMNECHNSGYRVKVYTSRGMTYFNGDICLIAHYLYDITLKQLENWGAKFDELIMGKVHFELLIDDKVANSKDINSFKDIQDRL